MEIKFRNVSFENALFDINHNWHSQERFKSVSLFGREFVLNYRYAEALSSKQIPASSLNPVRQILSSLFKTASSLFLFLI